MPRKSSDRPWLHAPSGYWCTTHNGRREYLDKDFEVACQRLLELKSDQTQLDVLCSDWLKQPFAVLANEYLDDVKARRSPTTYTSCRYRLRRALEVIGTSIPVGKIRKHHLARVEQRMTGRYSPTTTRDSLAAVQAVFAWAMENDLLVSNPLTGFRKPAARCRNRITQPHEFQALLRVSDVNFRRVMLTLRLTGCRPGEVRSLRWPWVDLIQGLWILPHHKSITRQKQPRPRIIPLPPAILKLCRWLARQPHDDNGYVFLNQRGRPYGKDTFCRKFDRIRRRAGIKKIAGEQLVLYSSRHAFCTLACGRVTDVELADLMGHSTTRLLQRYTHLNPDRLRDIQRRAQQ